MVVPLVVTLLQEDRLIPRQAILNLVGCILRYLCQSHLEGALVLLVIHLNHPKGDLLDFRRLASSRMGKDIHLSNRLKVDTHQHLVVHIHPVNQGATLPNSQVVILQANLVVTLPSNQVDIHPVSQADIHPVSQEVFLQVNMPMGNNQLRQAMGSNLASLHMASRVMVNQVSRAMVVSLANRATVVSQTRRHITHLVSRVILVILLEVMVDHRLDTHVYLRVRVL